MIFYFRAPSFYFFEKLVFEIMWHLQNGSKEGRRRLGFFFYFRYINSPFSYPAGKQLIIAGNGQPEVDEGIRKAFRAFFELIGVFTVGDAIPFLRWLDLGGYEKEMKRTGKKMDDLLQEWLDEHKRRKISGEAVEADKDFMNVMLEILDGGTNNALKFDADTVNKATCQVR